MNDIFKIVQIDKEKIKDLIPLTKTVFKKRTDIAYLERKLNSSAFGVSYLGYLAYDREGKAIAFYAIYPCRLMLNGQFILGAVAGDGMTVKEYRGRGLFTNLMNRTHDLAIEKGVKFIYGFPNQDSEKGFARVGVRNEKSKMNIYSLNIQTLPLAKISFLNFLYLPWLNIIFSKYRSSDKIFSSSNWDNDHVIHDADLFNYKNDKKKFLLSIEGRRIWIKIDKILKIGDLEGINEGEQMNILKKLMRLAFWSGCTEIQFATNVSSNFTEEFRKMNCSITSLPIVQIDLMADDLPDPSVQYVMCDNDTF